MVTAGFARETITPRLGLLMGGYRLRREAALGVHDDLYATCAVIRAGQTEIALVSLDLLCLPHEMVERMKYSILTKANIAPEYTLIACTHTHSGPETIGLAGQSGANDDYLASLPDIVSALVVAARQRARETKISILRTEVPDVAFNRRIELKDGSYAINIDRINPLDMQSAGITDPCATAIFFEVDSTTVGVIVNFTLHPTVLGEMNYLYSRDYPGYLVDALQDHLPGQPVGLFFNGAFGDINQIKTPGEWVSTFQEAQRIGERIASHLLDNHSRRTELKVSTLSAAAKRVNIPRRSAISKKCPETASSAATRYDIKENPSEGIHLSPKKESLFLQEVERLTDANHDLAELQILQLGEIEIVALPGEIFVELGLEIKRRSSHPYPLIFGNSNGYIGYVPTESSFAQGGYETRLSLTSRLAPEAGEIMLKSINQAREQI